MVSNVFLQLAVSYNVWSGQICCLQFIYTDNSVYTYSNITCCRVFRNKVFYEIFYISHYNLHQIILSRDQILYWFFNFCQTFFFPVYIILVKISLVITYLWCSIVSAILIIIMRREKVDLGQQKKWSGRLCHFTCDNLFILVQKNKIMD